MKKIPPLRDGCGTGCSDELEPAFGDEFVVGDAEEGSDGGGGDEDGEDFGAGHGGVVEDEVAEDGGEAGVEGADEAFVAVDFAEELSDADDDECQDCADDGYREYASCYCPDYCVLVIEICILVLMLFPIV